MISVAGLTKRYGSALAVDDVSFSIGPGEVVGLLGPNGAGKTSTMRVLTGYFAPSAGEVLVAGHDIVADPCAAKRTIGYLPEAPPVYPEMTVDRYLGFCAKLRGVTRELVSERVESAVDRCGLGGVASRLIGKLSRGYRQRVGLAQALVHSPSVLVMDEPTVALDPAQILEIRTLIRDLATESTGDAETRRTVLLSTHRLEDVTATCTRVIFITEGRIVGDESLAAATRGGSLEERYLALTGAGDPSP